MELAITEQEERELKDRLLEIRKTASPTSMCLVDPEKWLRVAVAVQMGYPVRRVMKECSVAQKTYYSVRKQILDIQNKYVDYKIDNIDVSLDAADDATSSMLELLHDSVEEMKGGNVDYDKAKATEALSSSLDRVQKAAVSLSMRKNKLQDKPDVVVEQRGPKIDYEARKKELLAMRKAEAIDVTEDN